MQEKAVVIPPYVETAMRALEETGHEAWVVGGCVRDSLLGRDVHDYDIATSAPWPETERALTTAGITVHRTGTAHGTVTASIDGQPIEITTYRTDGTYSDGRHPDSVEFVSTIEEDLARRDFTINAMAYHPERGLLDCWGGIEDLEARTIRVVGNAEARFREDALRVLRGCRFASQLGFSLEPGTRAAMIKVKTGLLRISAERITHEMDELLLGDYVHDALMDAVDVLVIVMPEIAACKGFDQHTPYHIYDVWEHTAWVVQRSPKTRLARWAALFHDIGKPAAFYTENGRGHFFRHPELSAVLAKGIMDRLLMSPSFQNDVLTLVRIHDRQIAATPRSVKHTLSSLGGDVNLFRTLCGIKKADALAQSELNKQRLELAGQLEAVLDEVLASDGAFTLKQLAINGNDVMALGVPAGPEVGELLDYALEAVIEERVENTRSSLMELLKVKVGYRPRYHVTRLYDEAGNVAPHFLNDEFHSFCDTWNHAIADPHFAEIIEMDQRAELLCDMPLSHLARLAPNDRVRSLFLSWLGYIDDELEPWTTGGAIHFRPHWARVLMHALVIADNLGLPDVDLRAVAMAAVFHDARRKSPYLDTGHGARAACYYAAACSALEDDARTGAAELAFDPRTMLAIAWHDRDDADGLDAAARAQERDEIAGYGAAGLTSYSRTLPNGAAADAQVILRIFKDADGLDRVRLGSNGLDERYLRTEQARRQIEFARTLLDACENLLAD